MSDEIRYRFIEDGDFLVFEDGRIFKKLDPPVSSNGYKFVRVGKKSYPLHRVIASAFIPNPENKPQVNHIDGKERRWNGNAWKGTDMKRNRVEWPGNDPPRKGNTQKRTGIELSCGEKELIGTVLELHRQDLISKGIA